MTPEPLLFISKFSGSWAVARRNSLYQILAINAASGAWLRAKSTLSGAHLRTGVGQSGRDCYRELPRTPLLGTRVNKGKRKGAGVARLRPSQLATVA